MNITEKKALVSRYIRLYTSGDLTIADEVFAHNFVDHTQPERIQGPEAVKREVQAFHAAFSSIQAATEEMICEGDTVAFRFVLRCTHTGTFGPFPPTGKEVVLTGMDFVHLAQGKIVALWSCQDSFTWVVQLGARIQWPSEDSQR